MSYNIRVLTEGAVQSLEYHDVTRSKWRFSASHLLFKGSRSTPVEHLRIVPVGGAAARDISLRIGHLHLTLNDLPWQWADDGGSHTVILVGLPPGEHTVRIEAVDPRAAPSPRKR